jgi:heme/copper-type cytochrome/quinol oxidase subunit 2
MNISNFWFYTIMIVVILHVVVAFVYLMIKLSPKKTNKKEREE